MMACVWGRPLFLPLTLIRNEKFEWKEFCQDERQLLYKSKLNLESNSAELRKKKKLKEDTAELQLRSPAPSVNCVNLFDGTGRGRERQWPDDVFVTVWGQNKRSFGFRHVFHGKDKVQQGLLWAG